jgi:integrase/recombinase XerD
MLGFLAGLRVAEIAALKVSDVVDGEGRARDQLRLNPAHTKGGFSRMVFMNRRLQREIRCYLGSFPALPAPASALLRSQKGGPFSANTLCQLFGELYRRAGIDGASSHSGRRGFITTQRYIEVNDEMKRAAVEILS